MAACNGCCDANADIANGWGGAAIAQANAYRAACKAQCQGGSSAGGGAGDGGAGDGGAGGDGGVDSDGDGIPDSLDRCDNSDQNGTGPINNDPSSPYYGCRANQDIIIN